MYFYGMYLLDKKTGFVRIELARRPESGEYVVSTRSYLHRMSAGEQEESDSTDTKRYAAEAPHRLLEIEQIEVNNGVTECVRYRRVGDAARIESEAGAEGSSRDVPVSEETLLGQLEACDLARRGEVGQSRSYLALDMDSGRDKPITVTLAKNRHILVNGIDTLMHELTTSMGEISMETVCDEKGHTQLFRIGTVMEMRLETEEQAMRLDQPSETALDLGVPVSGMSGQPGELSRVVLEWRRAPELLPARDFQRVEWKREGRIQIVELLRPEPPTAEEIKMQPPDDVLPFLTADSFDNSDHPRLRELAGEITKGLDGPWAKVQKIVCWVDDKLEDASGSNRVTALAALEAGAGDCTEHSILACGLLRAAGIPTRRVDGVMFAGEAFDAFGLHAWLEVWIGRWIPVDPTWSQVPADAAHVFYGLEQDTRVFGYGRMRARAITVEKIQPEPKR